MSSALLFTIYRLAKRYRNYLAAQAHTSARFSLISA